ncbi:hypothetical protein BJ742DRAFT_713998 [Cladochytrium replicatum]|nr:hypothetical protein BJ742DRAFT_713998 [Cladochytrium replicatum]
MHFVASTGTVLCLLSCAASTLAAPETFSYFKPRALVNVNTTQFGTFIEGTGVDAAGRAYAVNFGANTERNILGRINPETGAQRKFFVDADKATAFNGIRFLCDNEKDGQKESRVQVLLAADQLNKRVLKLVRDDAVVTRSVFCSDPAMLQGLPNDLAVDYKNKRFYLSGQAYNEKTVPADGEVWLCDKNGKATKISDETSILGRTNGIEVSLDSKTLYVSEAVNENFNPVSNKIISFKIKPDGTIDKASRKVFFDFAEDKSQNVDVDGMRIDTEGNLFATRNGNGEVVVLSPAGKLVRKIKLVSTNAPTNLEFAGPQGTDVVVVGRCGNADYGTGVGCLETFKSPNPGRAFTELVRTSKEKCAFL